MDSEIRIANSAVLGAEIHWFIEILDRRMKLHAGDTNRTETFELIAPPEVPPGSASPYARVLSHLRLSPAERLLLILALLPHIQPAALDPFFIQNRSLDRRFSEFGGVIGIGHAGFLPTAETAMFLLAGDDIQSRLRYQGLFDHQHVLYRRNILTLDSRQSAEPALSSALLVTAEYRERLTTGEKYQPPYSAEFPAQHITTNYEWSDLVLDPHTREDVEDILAWARHQRLLLDDWGLAKSLKPGFRTLFFGPPGTGKTLTASLLGKAIDRSVFRIDLSRVVSKYIGETEKNLASLFDHAQDQDWILFFDEADSLFGKRTESRNANDRAANQQTSYLLQRIEDFPGIVILASNLKSHLDEAFARRFQSMIHFPTPSYELRLRLWRDLLEDKPFDLAGDVDLQKLARDYKISGGSIINVLRFACLKAVVREPQMIHTRDLVDGIHREFHKEGKYPGASR